MGICRRRNTVPYAAVLTKDEDECGPTQPTEDVDAGVGQQTFIVTKLVMLRSIGVVYFFAFLAAYNQNRALLGSAGLSPAHSHLEQVRSRTAIDSFMAHPCIWWFWPLTDDRLDAVALAGVALSALVCVGACSSIVMLALWLLYFSIVTAAGGSSFYQYGWESQMLETGFLSIFLCELRPWSLSRTHPPSVATLWLFRWLMWRISIGAGLIKVRGDSCWTQRRCLWYHFETQPIPSPTSFFFHFLPKPILSAAIDLDLFVQLYSAWLVLVPGCGPLRWLRRMGGVIQAGFMFNIALSGNFSFLNHLTMIPALACLDDACWPVWLRPTEPAAANVPRGAPPKGQSSAMVRLGRLALDAVVVGTVGYLSLPVVENLLQLGGQQVMNSSFGSFRLVNTYGAFGSVGEARYEPILSISWDGRGWTELDFPCKPGNLTRRPCLSAPYHHRLDWNVWFIGFKPHAAMLRQREAWLYTLLAKLLTADELALSLLDSSAREVFRGPTGERRAPLYAKVDMWHYMMSAPLWELLPLWFRGGQPVVWWTREYEEPLIPVVLLHDGQLARAPLPLA